MTEHRPRVGVVSPVHPQLLDWLRARADTHYEPDVTQDDLRRAPLAGSDVLVLRSNVNVGGAELAGLPRLRLVLRAGSGTDNLDLPALSARNVSVVRIGGSASAPAVAELALQAVLALLRRLPVAAAELRSGRWTKTALLGAELAGRSVGIWGAGPVGLAAAKLFDALGAAPVFARHRSVRSGMPVADLEHLASTASIHVFALPRRPDTIGYVGPELLARFGAQSCLVNVGRWDAFDMPAVVDALARGHLAGVAVDPVDRAHVPSAQAFLTRTDLAGRPMNLQLSPHLGATTEESLRRVAEAAIAALAARWGDLCSTMPPRRPQGEAT
ncbi:NAD(P)-dependent oxidoreductase [Micromonospora sp. RP3T]|uniref:NAD(P)-dependent oxidoreductase n=1 Tax=Micromonospora sp. RP3T TaxID=2135446 RepID=UPI003D750330